MDTQESSQDIYWFDTSSTEKIKPESQPESQPELAGAKHDAGKPPMSLLPWAALREVAKVLEFGRRKYSAHNWRKGFAWSRLADADIRHLDAWIDGENLDPETKLNHLAHHVCEGLFLLEHVLKNYGTDDRYKE